MSLCHNMYTQLCGFITVFCIFSLICHFNFPPFTSSTNYGSTEPCELLDKYKTSTFNNCRLNTCSSQTDSQILLGMLIDNVIYVVNAIEKWNDLLFLKVYYITIVRNEFSFHEFPDA